MADDKVVSLGDRRAKKQKASEPKPFPLKVALVLVVDGQAKQQIMLDAEIAAPADGQGVGVVFPLDARALAQMLEQVVGPSQQAAKLWTPGAQPVRLVTKD